MKSLQCLIADMPQAILVDILKRTAARSENIEVADRILSMEELPEALEQNPVDVLIVGMEKITVPKIYSELMNRHSNLLVVGLIDDGRTAAVFVNDIGSDEITDLITLLGKR